MTSSGRTCPPWSGGRTRVAKRSDDRYPTGSTPSAARAAVGEIPAITAGAVPVQGAAGGSRAPWPGAVIGIVALLLATRSDPGTGPAGRPSPNAIHSRSTLTEVDPTTREPLGDPIGFPPRGGHLVLRPTGGSRGRGRLGLASISSSTSIPSGASSRRRSRIEPGTHRHGSRPRRRVPDRVGDERDRRDREHLRGDRADRSATNEHLRQLGFQPIPAERPGCGQQGCYLGVVSDGTVVEIDPITLETRRTFELGGLDAITVSDDAVWVADGSPAPSSGSTSARAGRRADRPRRDHRRHRCGWERYGSDALAGTVTQVGETGGGAIVRRVGEDATDISVSSTEFNELVGD